jgi:hypothetical protein
MRYPLQESYQRQLVTTRTRVNQEKAGDRAYTAAVAEAQLAQTAQRQGQWTMAVRHWRRAVDDAQQVPEGPDAIAKPRSYSMSIKDPCSGPR